MKDFERVLGLSKRHGAWILLSLISMVVVAGATVFTFNLLRPICDEILQPGQQSSVVADTTVTGLVGALDRVTARAQGILDGWFGARPGVLLILAVVAMVVKNIFAFLARFASARFGLATIRDLRALFYRSLLAQSPTFFHDRSTAALPE